MEGKGRGGEGGLPGRIYEKLVDIIRKTQDSLWVFDWLIRECPALPHPTSPAVPTPSTLPCYLTFPYTLFCFVFYYYVIQFN